MPAEDRPIGQPYGTATLGFGDGSNKDYLVYDGDFAEELFKAACANIVYDEDSAGELVTAACANIGSATP